MTKPALNIDKHLQLRKLEHVVENRTAYTLEQAELSIFETHESVNDIAFQFNSTTLASMVRGKKIIHIDNKPSFEFLAGESMILATGQTCIIDFPEASKDNPVECLKLSISQEKIASFCDRLNEKYPLIDSSRGWNYNTDGNRFMNDAMINQLLSRLVLICTENNEAKDFFANLVLQELVVRLMQTQARYTLLDKNRNYNTSNRFAHVAEYIQRHLQDNISVKTLSREAYMSEPHFFRCFKQQFGMSPVDYINERRIRAAKMMLQAADISITEISFACGFNNLNYFLKMFKRHTGLTPAQYRKSLHI
jgi:AraC family transcriptional regulator